MWFIEGNLKRIFWERKDKNEKEKHPLTIGERKTLTKGKRKVPLN